MTPNVDERADDGAETGVPGAFPRPPLAFTDEEGRRIDVATDGAVLAPLEEMYDAFTAEHRAQGLPPVDDRRRREWLDCLLSDGLNVVSWHDEAAVGHATLVPIDDGACELAIFVAPEYQHAGIGSTLIRALLGHGQARGVGRVWLTVQRHNRVAINLYESVGFRTVHGGHEWEMERDL